MTNEWVFSFACATQHNFSSTGYNQVLVNYVQLCKFLSHFSFAAKSSQLFDKKYVFTIKDLPVDDISARIPRYLEMQMISQTNVSVEPKVTYLESLGSLLKDRNLSAVSCTSF
jgi:hypothetical protein